VPGRSSTFGSTLESLIAVSDRGKKRIERTRPQALRATDNSPMIHHGVAVSILIVKPWQGRQNIRPPTREMFFVPNGTFRNNERGIAVIKRVSGSLVVREERISEIHAFRLSAPKKGRKSACHRCKPVGTWRLKFPKAPVGGDTLRCQRMLRVLAAPDPRIVSPPPGA